MKRNQVSEVLQGNKKRFSEPYIDSEPALANTKPNGPFKLSDEGHEGDLLIFVPCNAKSRTIDQMTGKYGYSHLAIDCGENRPANRPTCGSKRPWAMLYIMLIRMNMVNDLLCAFLSKKLE